jgi:hypothetical protein
MMDRPENDPAKSNVEESTEGAMSIEDQVEAIVETEGHEIISVIDERFEDSKRNRREAEYRWLRAYTNFRGRYGDEVEFLETEVSRVFIKVTKSKTMAAYGQLLDVLLGGPQFPISVGPTEKPEGVPESIHIDPNDQDTQEEAPDPRSVDSIGFDGDGNDVDPQEGWMERAKRIAMETLKLKDVKIKEGGATGPGMITLNPAQIAGEQMTMTIQDQLTESKIRREFRKFLLEKCIIGTSCMKGPFHSSKEYPRWDEDGNYTPETKVIPVCKFSSTWNNYPDSSANSMDESEFNTERHRYSLMEMRALRKQPGFRPNAIDKVIDLGPNYVDEHWEYNIREGLEESTSGRWEVLEHWGKIDRDILVKYEEAIAEESDEEYVESDYEEEVAVNVFISGGEILRLVVNPFTPMRIPYFACPYEEDPYNMWGVGVPENMEDSQTMMNGFARLAVDNAVLSGNIMLEVDTDNLEPGQTMDIHSGKIWERQGGQPGQTIHPIEFPNTASSNMMMYD